MTNNVTVAIDGPSGAGKSTVGVQVAERIGAIYFDTGVLYRTVAYVALGEGVAPSDATRLASIAADLHVDVTRPSVDDGRLSDVLLDGEDVTWLIRIPDVDRTVSEVSAHPLVRAALLDAQRRIARSGQVVMVGRDIGTVVIPDADVKIFLNASLRERARRRERQLLDAGRPEPIEQILADMERRDRIDSTRAASPLIAAEDAVVVESDGLSIEQVVDHIVGVIERRCTARTTDEVPQ